MTPASPSNPSGYVFEGPWALFRLLDRVRSEPSGAANRQQLVFDIEGRRARFEASSLHGPLAVRLLALEAFQCPKGL